MGNDVYLRFHFGLDTRASPEQVFTAFTDMSHRRLEVWSKTLDPAKYEVREQGEHLGLHMTLGGVGALALVLAWLAWRRRTGGAVA